MKILPRHILYWVLSGVSLALVAFEAPGSRILSSSPERIKPEKGASARGRPVFIWTGGGYHGGK